MALVGIELETLVSEPDALTTRPPPCAILAIVKILAIVEIVVILAILDIFAVLSLMPAVNNFIFSSVEASCVI